MKHIKFEFAEPIIAIQRVRNEVFLDTDGNICFSNHDNWRFVVDVIYEEDNTFPRKVRPRYNDDVWYTIRPHNNFWFTTNGDEIIVMKGKNTHWVEDELGNVIAF